MAQLPLQGYDVRAAFQVVGGITMPKGMGRSLAADARPLLGLLKCMLRRAPAIGAARVPPVEQQFFGLVSRKVLPQGLFQPFGNGYIPVLGSFSSLDEQLHALHVYIRQPYAQGLAQAQARSV